MADVDELDDSDFEVELDESDFDGAFDESDFGVASDFESDFDSDFAESDLPSPTLTAQNPDCRSCRNRCP